ncbi:hypothetical protein TNCV_4172611 [Trichonephila clavipes]|nr:hypothetical protein TNCV_4172611 [Trichonephila clavipes]
MTHENVFRGAFGMTHENVFRGAFGMTHENVFRALICSEPRGIAPSMLALITSNLLLCPLQPYNLKINLVPVLKWITTCFKDELNIPVVRLHCEAWSV